MSRKHKRNSVTLSNEIINRVDRAHRRASSNKRQKKRTKRLQRIFRCPVASDEIPVDERKADADVRLHVAQGQGHASTSRGTISNPLNGNTSRRMHTGEKKKKIIDEAKENDKRTKKTIEKKERALRNSLRYTRKKREATKRKRRKMRK